MSWSFEVRRDAIASSRVAETGIEAADLAPGAALLAIERFALTANNVTYAKTGESLGYWRFFPTEPGWGVVPAWGFASVVASSAPDLPVGSRLYGYLPMASHLVIRPVVHGRDVLDASAHRADLPGVYNRYVLSEAYRPSDDHQALLQPLLVTSFLLDEYLGDASFFGAARIVLSSASSKTALGLAWLSKRRGVALVAGLTSSRNLVATMATGCYDRVVAYEDLEALADGTRTVFVDFAGDRAILRRVHAALGASLVRSLGVGATRMSARDDAPASAVEGVAPEFFFAPDHARRRIDAWGASAFAARSREAISAFAASSPWLRIDELRGVGRLGAAWQDLVDGSGSPSVGVVMVVA